MAYQKLQVSSAIRVIPSDDVNIPNPSSPNVEGAIQAKGPNYQIQFTGSGGNNNQAPNYRFVTGESDVYTS